MSLLLAASKEELRTQRDAILTPFKPLIERMVRSLQRLVQLDEEHEGTPSADSEMKEFRVEVYDVLRDVAFIRGSVEITALVLEGVMQAEQSAWYQVRSYWSALCMYARRVWCIFFSK